MQSTEDGCKSGGTSGEPVQEHREQQPRNQHGAGQGDDEHCGAAAAPRRPRGLVVTDRAASPSQSHRQRGRRLSGLAYSGP